MASKAQSTAPQKGSKAPMKPAALKGPVKGPLKAPVKAAPAPLAPGMTPTLQKPEEATPMTPKNFRNHPDMENFFRFIYENDLRHEALHIIDEIIVERQNKRSKKPVASA